MTTTNSHRIDDGAIGAHVFAFEPISPADADALRAAGGEVYAADAVPGFPCRQCLRDAAIGEELILVSHDPFDHDSPYRSASPIFLHRDDCGGPDRVNGAGGPGRPGDEIGLPDQLTVRQLAVRAFDPEAMMLDATVIDGSELAATIDAFFANPSVDHAQVYFAQRGCWATRVTRGDRG
ncbi:MAG: DUF1203 domain-containing protein [Actinomycetota bacterium]